MPSQTELLPGLSVVIPCYKSAPMLPELSRRLIEVLGATCEAFEVVLVVDGSPDNTWDVARQLAEQHANVSAIRLSRNYGQHNALLAGIRSARYATLVTMDDDLQHPPEQIPTLLAALTDDVDLTYGVPIVEEHGALRSFASRSVKRVMTLGLGITDASNISAFRIFRTRLRDAFEGLDGPHASIDVALSWATARTTSATVHMDRRAEGQSNYSFRLLVRHAINTMLGYSTLPLRLVGYLGLVCGGLGIILLAVVLWQYFSGTTTVQGFTTVASMVAIFSGAQMVALAIVGEYIARIHSENLGRPTYVISERSRDDQ
ncbi:glycosyltransferase family 2 protein [Aeromicrobium sp. 9AM]|uniref:glycosyltransferase family 2 protein n=1 Tax=Aeromicrobium sp. 9AM TaxID=2653126 RepID=UPI0012F09164|nr:glycosyltransferase family 2 protein [Aeromicrobium sp. 9AM]VXC35826.1 Glycosyl transferase family 2 [Aeromicrobium sp. 9AM]